jgi:phage baseplate assembly protein W
MAEDILVGRGWSFPVGPGPTGGIGLSSHVAEIEQAIRITIGTSPGERAMRPTFGCRIHELVFAPLTDETLGLARRYVQEALGMWEPRIEVDAVLAAYDLSERERGRLNIMVAYTIRATKDPRSLVYPFYLIERD